nr:hypothetical protein [Candidatus Delongbacteria bacterium]
RQIGQKTFDSESHGLSGPHTIGLDSKALIPGQSNKFILRNSDEVSYCQGGSPSNPFNYVYLQHDASHYAYLQLQIGQPAGYQAAPNPLPIDEPYNSGVFTITASGAMTGSITSITSSTPWIQSVNPTSGMLSPNQSIPITVTTDPLRKNYSPGTYQGSVSIVSPIGNTDVAVNWQVGNHPELSSPVDQVVLSDPHRLGEVFTLTNTGNVPLILQSIQSTRNWLTILQGPNPGSGLPADQSLGCQVQALTEGLGAGTHNAAISIGYDQSVLLTAARNNSPAAAARSYNFTMPVTLAIPARYDIQADPADLTLSDAQPMVSVVLINNGNTALTWESAIETGLTLDQSSGSLAMGERDTLEAGFNTLEVAAGAHIKRMVFRARADGFVRDSAVVTVNLTVAPSVRVMSPNGGESWIAGEAYPILYQSNTPDLVFRYSTDNGNVWEAAQSPAVKGIKAMTLDTFTWLTPAGITSSQCLVKIAMLPDSLAVFDMSDTSFVLAEPKSLSLVEPNGGEWIFRNRTVPVRWNYSGLIDSLLITLHQGTSRLMADTLARVKASDTVCHCLMPDQVYDTAWLKISRIGLEADIFDFSDSFFILGDTLGYTFIEPQDTTCYMAGNLAVVGWTVQGPPSGVSLEVSYDRGTLFTHLTDLPHGTRYYNWTPPLMVRDSVLLRLTSLEYPETSILSPPFSLIYPVRFVQHPMVTSLTDQACRVEWQTDWPVNAVLKLWSGDNPASAVVYPAGQAVRFHEATLSGLIPAEIYHYRIMFGLDSVMIDSSGVFDFTTLSTAPADTLRISGKPQVLYVGRHKILVRFMTRGRMNGAVQFTSSDGAHVLDMMNDSPKTIHELMVDNLYEDQLYYCRLGYWDSATQKHHWEPETYPVHT